MKTYSPREVADLFGTTSDNWLREGARTGKYPHIRPGRCVRFTDEHVAAITELIEHQPQVKANIQPVPDLAIAGVTSRSQARHRTRKTA